MIVIYIALAIIFIALWIIDRKLTSILQDGISTERELTFPEESVIQIANLILDEIDRRKKDE